MKRLALALFAASSLTSTALMANDYTLDNTVLDDSMRPHHFNFKSDTFQRVEANKRADKEMAYKKQLDSQLNQLRLQKFDWRSDAYLQMHAS